MLLVLFKGLKWKKISYSDWSPELCFCGERNVLGLPCGCYECMIQDHCLMFCCITELFGVTVHENIFSKYVPQDDVSLH